MKTKSDPWHEISDTTSYPDVYIKNMAKQVAKDEGAKLLDWRLILPHNKGNCITLQVRYLLEDGIARFSNIAL